MFFPIHFYADPIHVSFSIPIEFWWSLIVFLLYLFLFSKQFFRLSVLCVAVIASCIFSSKLIQVVPGWNSFYQNFFLEFGIFFLMGFCSYHIRMLIINLKFPHYKFLVIFFAIVLVLTPIFEIDYRAAISVLAFVYLVFGNYIPSVRKKALLNLSQIPIIVGNMCYSIYLLHYPILRLFSFWFENQILIACCTLICTLVFSVISFYLIEIPFIRLGRRLAKRF
jgi:peptidoglycan/LPS O-acetylase OafA/YrhL